MERYRSFVRSVGNLLESGDAGARARALTAALGGMTGDWATMKTDAGRLLRVWAAMEETEDVANAAIARVTTVTISELLEEMAAAAAGPTLVIAETVAAPKDKIAHISDALSQVALSQIVAAEDTVVEIEESEAEEAASAESASEVVEEEEAEEEVEEEAATEMEVEEAEAESEDAETEMEVEEEEEEAEVIEPEEEAEEEGLEVEKITIRGRSYWHEVNDHTLYAVLPGDDVGDAIGDLVDGKPRFYAK